MSAAAKLYVICGHGAGDPGAPGGGYTEAERVRALAAEMGRQGGSKVEVLDTGVNWYKSRLVNASLKNRVGRNPVIELHMDAADGDGPAVGAHVAIKAGFSPDEWDVALADFLSGYFPGRADMITSRANLGNLNRAASHGINYRLAEVGMIDDRRDREKFNANIPAVAAGILAAFGIGGAVSAPAQTPAPQPVKPTVTAKPSSKFGGKYRCNASKLNVRDRPSLKGNVVASYSKGQTVNLDDNYTIADGYVWGTYIGRSGKRRYIAVGKHTGKPEANDYLVKV